MTGSQSEKITREGLKEVVELKGLVKGQGGKQLLKEKNRRKRKGGRLMARIEKKAKERRSLSLWPGTRA